jgi:arginyl-tRNA synthetase
MSNYKQKIIKVLEEVTGIKNPEVEFSANEQFGDYSSNIALKNKELDIDNIVQKINELSNDFTAEKLGRFINFRLKNDVLVDNLMQIDSQKEDYGKSEIGKGKTAIVEYSSPNIAKPFGVGHLRSTVIGDAVANLMESVGFNVLRDNHVGDWGTQFGKVIYAIKKWGDIEAIEKSASPVDELVNLYVKYHEASKLDPKIDDDARSWFKKLEDGDGETRELWQKCIDLSWIEFEKIYELLGIKFYKEFNNGRGLGESFFETRMKTVLDELEKKELLKVGEDGARLVFFDENKLPPAMIIKKDGATLYSTRDLATDKYRLEKYAPDIIINEVGNEQSLYFKQLFEIEKILGWYKEGQRIHVGHGLYMMDGKKMSTRAGKTVKLDEVLTEAIERASKLEKDGASQPADSNTLARQVGVGAIKYFDLSHQPSTNINFDWDTMFTMDGNSSPYIQYTVARCNSVMQKSEIRNPKSESFEFRNSSFEITPVELKVLRSLSQFQEIIVTASKTYSPNILCNYLYELASKFNTFYNAHRIIGLENKNDESFRIMLTAGTAQVLKNGLKILGIESPERM